MTNRQRTVQLRGYFGSRRQKLPPLQRQPHPEDWPAIDRARWEAACISDDPLGSPGPAAHLAMASRKIREASWGSYLSSLAHTGELDANQPPESRLTFERLTRYIASLSGRVRAGTMHRMIVDLSLVITAMAPGRDWSWIRRHPGRPTQAQIRTSRKPINPPDASRVTAAAMELCDTAVGMASPLKAAVRFRDGLILIVLGSFTLRLKNLAEIRIGEHLLLYPTHMRLVFDTTVKNREVIDTPVPGWIAAYLRTYLEIHRPALVQGLDDHGALWVNIDGQMLNYTVVGHIVRNTTDRLGFKTNPHAFRHALATTLMERDPRNIAIASAALAHRGTSSVNQVYDRSGNLGAQKYWLKFFRDQRRKIEADRHDEQG